MVRPRPRAAAKWMTQPKWRAAPRHPRPTLTSFQLPRRPRGGNFRRISPVYCEHWASHSQWLATERPGAPIPMGGERACRSRRGCWASWSRLAGTAAFHHMVPLLSESCRDCCNNVALIPQSIYTILKVTQRPWQRPIALETSRLLMRNVLSKV